MASVKLILKLLKKKFFPAYRVALDNVGIIRVGTAFVDLIALARAWPTKSPQQ
jgi:hypothetical protein